MNKEKETVFIVDDNQVNIKLLEKILLKIGYEIISATSGKEALRLVDKMMPDLILLDVIMPEMDGYEVCKKLKSSPDTCDIPVIFLTAKTETDNIVRGFEAGAADYIRKPFQRVELQARVETHLRVKKMQMKILEQDLLITSLARIDPLTGVNNRRYFIEALTQELERSRRYENSLSLLIINVDHFKSINDLYGHDTGDRILKTLCDAGRKVFRKTDIFARIGGGEFAVILPHTGHSSSIEVAERFLKRIEELSVKSLRGEVNFTVSIGIAIADEQTKDCESIMRKADKALSLAREKGRGRVEVY